MNVTETLSPAWERMKAMLFRPFSIGTWFTFGFIFTLQSCVEGGGGGNFNVPNGNSGGSSRHHNYGSGSDTNNAIMNAGHDLWSSMSHGLSKAGSGDDFDPSNFDTSMLIPILVIAIIVAIPLLLLVYWLGARGQMMSIRSVAIGRADIGESWRETAGAGGGMFKFHLVAAALGLVAFGPLLGIGGVMTWGAIQTAGDDPDAKITAVMPIIIGVALVAFVLMIPFAIMNSLARSFVAPIMLKHQLGPRDAWKRFWAVGKDNVGRILLFFVLKILVNAVAGVIGVIAGFVTCCFGFLPVIHQTVMAPYYVFERAWTLEILASMSPDFDLRSGPMPQGPIGYAPPGFSGQSYTPGYNPYAPPGAGGPSGYGGPPPPGGFGGGGYGPPM